MIRIELNTIPGQSWHEVLPLNCPPFRAQECTDQIVYRCVSAVPSAKDFDSMHKKQKSRARSVTEECKHRGVSVFRDPQEARMVLMLERHAHEVLMKVIIHPGMGRILATPSASRPSHYTWWVARDAVICGYLLTAEDET